MVSSDLAETRCVYNRATTSTVRTTTSRTCSRAAPDVFEDEAIVGPKLTSYVRESFTGPRPMNEGMNARVIPFRRAPGSVVNAQL